MNNFKEGDPIIWDSNWGYDYGYFIGESPSGPSRSTVHLISGIYPDQESSVNTHEILPYNAKNYRLVADRYRRSKLNLKEIPEAIVNKAEKLSSEWDNTGFVVLLPDGNLKATVWNHYKDSDPKRPIVAHVNFDGWEIDKKFVFEYKSPTYSKYRTKPLHP